jgi:hypothetical protein
MDSKPMQQELDQLDHQRDRIQEILAHKIVSADMARDLRRRLDAITRRLRELSGAGSSRQKPN